MHRVLALPFLAQARTLVAADIRLFTLGQDNVSPGADFFSIVNEIILATSAADDFIDALTRSLDYTLLPALRRMEFQHTMFYNSDSETIESGFTALVGAMSLRRQSSSTQAVEAVDTIIFRRCGLTSMMRSDLEAAASVEVNWDGHCQTPAKVQTMEADVHPPGGHLVWNIINQAAIP